MTHSVETAPTGRALCRACGEKIAKGERRFGERLPNPFSDDGGEMTHWFHLACAAYARPEPFLETIESVADPIDGRDDLIREAQAGVAHRRLPRLRGAERATSARAACRQCKEPIAKDTWRLALAYYEDGRFSPSGFIHATCAQPYLETTDVVPRLRHFSPALTAEDLAEIDAAVHAPG